MIPLIFISSTDRTIGCKVSLPVRSLLPLTFAVLLSACDGASSTTSTSSTTSFSSSTTEKSTQITPLEQQSISNSSDDPLDAIQDNPEHDGYESAQVRARNTRQYSPMISEKSDDSALQATLMGDYGGVLPCLSCSSIEITLNLFADGSVTKTSAFKNSKTLPDTAVNYGTYKQDKDEIIIVYGKRVIERYLIQNNNLVRLDGNGEANNDYTLSRL